MRNVCDGVRFIKQIRKSPWHRSCPHEPSLSSLSPWVSQSLFSLAPRQFYDMPITFNKSIEWAGADARVAVFQISSPFPSEYANTTIEMPLVEFPWNKNYFVDCSFEKLSFRRRTPKDQLFQSWWQIPRDHTRGSLRLRIGGGEAPTRGRRKHFSPQIDYFVGSRFPFSPNSYLAKLCSSWKDLVRLR